MIVIGADTHKRSHTVAAVDAATGRLLDEQTIAARRRSFDALLIWARGHGGERVWAIEDCRHVSGALERFLLARGEAVVRVAPKLTAGARSTARELGKSDVIDAIAICVKASTACPSRDWPARSSRCGCSSTTASGSSASARR
jgi:transposase